MAPLPGWNSVEATTKAQQLMVVAGAVWLGLLAASAGLAFLYGHRKAFLLVAQNRAIEQHHLTEVTEVDSAYSNDATIPIPAVSKSAGSSGAAVAEVAAARRLTKEQKDTLIVALRQYTGQQVRIVCVPNDVEGIRFAQDFVAVFRSAGWDLGGGSGVHQAVIKPDPVGIEVTLNTGEVKSGQIMEGVGPLMDALMDIGLLQKKNVVLSPHTPADVIEFRVGLDPDHVPVAK